MKGGGGCLLQLLPVPRSPFWVSKACISVVCAALCVKLLPLVCRQPAAAYQCTTRLAEKPQLPVAPGTRLTALGWGDTRPGTFSPSEPLQQVRS